MASTTFIDRNYPAISAAWLNDVNTLTYQFTQSGTGATSRTAVSKLKDFVHVKDFGAVGDGTTDDTAAIQRAVSASLHVYFGGAGSTYRVTNSISLQSGSDLWFNGATVRQEAVNKQIFNLDGLSNIRAIGGRFQGVGSDFNNIGGVKSAFRGIGATDIFISGCWFYNFADTALTITASDNVFFIDNVVIGPGAPTIAPDDGTCAGVLIGNGCTNVHVRGNNISDTCQGVTSGNGCVNVVLASNNIHDIPGQHGIYMGSGAVNLVIAGNTINSTNLQGIKVQNYDTPALYADSIAITGNTISNTGSHGIIVINTTVAPTYVLRNVSVTGNTIDGTSLDDGINITACTNVTVESNIVNSATRDGIRFSSCTQLMVTSNIVSGAGNNGMRELLACSRVTIRGNSIYDCCTTNTVAEEQGIYVLLGTDYTIVDNVVRDSGGNMRYGIQNSSVNQATFTVARNLATGATDYGARFVGTGTNMLYYADNIFSGTSGEVLNAPATDQRGNRARTFYGTAAPVSGPWQHNDILWNTATAAGGTPGWICTTAGTPGTWKAMASVAP